MPPMHFLCESELIERHPRHHLRPQLGRGHADSLADKRNRPRRPRVDLQYIEVLILDGELNIHQPLDLQLQRKDLGLPGNLSQQLLAYRNRRQRARAITRVHTRLLDMLHNPTDYNSCAVAYRIHVQLGCIVEKLVDQNRVLAGSLDSIGNAGLKRILVIDNLHSPAAQDKARPNQHRVAQLLRNLERLFVSRSRAAIRLEQLEFSYELIESLAVLGPVDAVRRGPDYLDPGLLERERQLKRSLPPELHNHAVRILLLDYAHHVFERHRLEIKPIRSIVIRADPLRVAVHHNRLDPDLAEREGGMDAAVVELDALAYAIRSSA